jgi:superfamily II DNA or RNA helicase
MNLGEWFDESEKEELYDYDDESKVVTLRDWQRRAKEYFFEHNGNCIFEVTTGAGKTFFTINIIEELLEKEPDLKILIIVPKNIILETGWYKELVDGGIPIQKIGVYYGQVKEYAQITITNMQNIKKIPLEIFDMLVADELHNYATTKLLDIINHPFKYKIGLTATLKRMDNKHFKLMKLFNYNIFEYKPQDALDDGVLNPFIFFNYGVNMDNKHRVLYDEITSDLNTVFKIGGSYEYIMRSTSPLKNKMLMLINKRKNLVNNYYKKFEIAREIILKNKDNKIIVFNQFNEQTSKLYWYLLEDNIDCRIIHSGIEQSKREKNLIDFKNNKYNVLLTSKVLDEGYNLPKLDLAIIMAGDSTDKQTIQRMGRVLRKKKGQDSKLYQIYCVNTIEEKNSIERSKIFKKLSSDYSEKIFI